MGILERIAEIENEVGFYSKSLLIFLFLIDIFKNIHFTCM